jgi:hypothetical protein
MSLLVLEQFSLALPSNLAPSLVRLSLMFQMTSQK